MFVMESKVGLPLSSLSLLLLYDIEYNREPLPLEKTSLSKGHLGASFSHEQQVLRQKHCSQCFTDLTSCKSLLLECLADHCAIVQYRLIFCGYTIQNL